MSHHDNLKRPLPEERSPFPEERIRTDESGWSMSTLVIGGIAALAVVFGLMFMLSGSPTGPSTATNVDRPVVTPSTTTPAQPRATETTGSGAATTTVPPGTTSPPR